MDIGHITRCPRMDSIRFSTRSIGTVIGLSPLGEWFPSGVTHLPCRHGPKRERPRKGAFLHDERSSSGAVSVLSRMSAIRSAGGDFWWALKPNIYNCIFLRFFSETEDFEERFSK